MKQQTLTLATLHTIKSVVSIRRLALAAGISAGTLRQRMARMHPELTPSEAATLAAALASAGVYVMKQ